MKSYKKNSFYIISSFVQQHLRNKECVGEKIIIMKHKRKGCGILDSIVNKIPVEMHIPGYQYCGPGTKLHKRLKRGDPGINPLGKACKQHDIVYSQYNGGPERYEADKLLAKSALKRVTAKDASLQERASALPVAAAMKTKMGLSKIGGKLKKRVKCMKKKCTFANLIRKAKIALKKSNPTNLKDAIAIPLKKVKYVKKSEIKQPRIIPVPKSGGALPLIPIFAGLSALGALAGGATSIMKAINEAQQAKQLLSESQRHNRMMEAVALGKPTGGNGLYLKPYKRGFGLYLKPYSASKNP